jgi:peptidoglycan glycosyltransferase
VIIARLDDRLAGLQMTWIFIGIAAFCVTLSSSSAPRTSRGTSGRSSPRARCCCSCRSSRSRRELRRRAHLGQRRPINFQPGEFAKIALALFFAGYLAERRELIATGTWKVGPLRLPEPRHLMPIAVAWAFSVVVMVGLKDLGASLLFFALFVVMLWVATERTAYLLLGVALFAGAAYVAWRVIENVQTRVAIWTNPWPQYEGKGYQVIQSWFALSNGGTAGTGLGLGSPNKIPEVKNDFIFAAIGEELGLFGGTAVLIAFVLIIGAGFRTAIRADRPFEKILATGLTTILGLQAFIIIGGVIRLVPLTGITLPFVSYGGSSLVANYVLLALLLRISDSTARRLGEVPDELTIGERLQARRAARAQRRSLRATR